jgi:hypothetical protein
MKYEVFKNPRANVPDLVITTSYNVGKDRWEAHSDRGIFDAIQEHVVLTDVIMCEIDQFHTIPFRLYVKRKTTYYRIVPVRSLNSYKVMYVAHKEPNHDGTTLSTTYDEPHRSLTRLIEWLV